MGQVPTMDQEDHKMDSIRLELSTRRLMLGDTLKFKLVVDELASLPNPAPWDVYRVVNDERTQITSFGTTQNVVHVMPDNPAEWSWTAETQDDFVYESDDERRVVEYPDVIPGRYVVEVRTWGHSNGIEDVDSVTIEEQFEVINGRN